MLPHIGSRCVLPALAAMLLVGLGACTTATITPEFVKPAKQTVHTVAIGDITTDEELWQLYIPHFRHGLINKLNESDAFEEVLETAPETMLPGAVLITGKLTEIDKGSAAARWIIGFGAGREKARGEFQISDDAGLALARFQSWKAYSGGAGIGGAGFVDIEDLVEELGQQVAGSVIRWSRGEPLEPPNEKPPKEE